MKIRIDGIIKQGVLLLLGLPCFCFPQTPDALLKIINDTGQIESRQQQIDSFLRVNQDTIPPHQLADCYHDLGSKWYYKKWKVSQKRIDLKNAIQVTNKALDLKRGLEQLEDCSMNKTLYNLGYFLSLGDHIHEAKDMYVELIEKGLQYCTENSQKDSQILWALRRLGELYLMTGDFYRAMDSYRTLISTIDSYDKISQQDYRMLIFSHLKLANLYFRISSEDNLDLIKKNLGLAQDYLTESGLPCCQKQIHINQQYGNAFWQVENYSEALKYHKKALGFLPLEDSLDLAIVHNSLGTSYLKLESDTLALKSFRKAIAYDIHYSDPFNNLGDFFVKKKDFEKAMKNYQRAIDLKIGKDKVFSADSIPAIDDLDLVPDKIPLLNHVVTKANGWIKYYEYDGNDKHLERALETFTLADNLVDLIRFESTEHQSKLFWREQGASLYMKAVEVCHLLNKPQEAFHFMERNKALLLLEDLTNEEAKEIAKLPKEFAEREFKLKREIYLSENNLQEAGNESNELIANLKDSIRKNKYRYEQFVDSLNASYPDYAKFKKKVDVLTFENLKTNYVSDTKAVLHYILNEEHGYGLLTLADTTLLYKMNNIPKLNGAVETLIASLSDGISDIDMFQKVSHAVFQQLLPENSYDKIKGKQLLIIPDYTLQRIPFETLVVNKAETKYLIEEVEIGYAYSASLLDYSKRTKRNAEENFLGFAPVQFNDLGLPQLSFSENEIEGIADVLPGKTLLNGKASKSNFIKNVNQHKIVHLATHADLGNGENPWIAFSDSKMYLKEIYATRNQADMVVLSGCNTSNGELKRGEGVMSLARGFFYSGAKSVVSSLWPIEDEAGKDILIAFYKNLGQGDSKSKALRKAKLSYLKTADEEELKHPFYWAGFVVLGDNAPVTEAFNWNWIFILLALVVVSVLVYRFRSIKGVQ